MGYFFIIALIGKICLYAQPGEIAVVVACFPICKVSSKDEGHISLHSSGRFQVHLFVAHLIGFFRYIKIKLRARSRGASRRNE